MISFSKQIQWAGLFFLIMARVSAESTTTFAIGKYAHSKTGHYANNLKLNKVLRIPNADELEVTIRGKVEKCCDSKTVTKKCCDYLTLYDGNEQEIGKFSGIINEHITVMGSTVRVTFRSDRRTTDEGVKVTISARLPASIFNEIKQQLLEVTEQFLTFGTPEAYVKIRHNLQSIKTLHTKLIQREEIDSIINEVAIELLAIAKTYQEIAAMAPEINAAHQEQFNLIKDLKSKTFYNTEKIIKKKQNYQNLLDTVQVNTDLDRLEKQKMQFSINGYQSIVQTLDAQQVIWDKFYEAQELLEQKLAKYSQKLSVLLHILNINAQLYEQAANVALLRRTTILSLNNLTNLTELQKIITDIETSEQDITQLLNKIEQTKL